MQGATPSADLSVVVVSLVGGDALAHCLERLPTADIECVVVLRDRIGDPRLWERRFPTVRFLPTNDDPVPLSRRRGIEASAGAIVGLIEDTSWPEPGWCAAVMSAFANRQVVAAGGPVAIARSLSNRCQALGWVEFGAFVLGREPSSNVWTAAARVPGNNMAFRRASLLRALAGESGVLENVVCLRLKAQGGEVVHAGGMAVTFSACNPDGATLVNRFHHGRLYSAGRVAGAGRWKQVLAARAALLPAVLTFRGIRRIARGHGRSNFFLIVVWITLMETAWALGEAVGAGTGAGDSLKAWR